MSESSELRLTIAPIDYAAPGSRRLELTRQTLSRAFTSAIEVYNESIDAMNDARDLVVADPANADGVLALEAAIAAVTTTRAALAASREAYHQHLIGRMTTSDGTSVDDALDMISWDDFSALVRSDVESVVIPKVGAAS